MDGHHNKSNHGKVDYAGNVESKWPYKNDHRIHIPESILQAEDREALAVEGVVQWYQYILVQCDR